MSIDPLLVGVEDARRMLGGRGRGTVYGLIKSGDLETVVDGGRRFVVVESIVAYVARLRRETSLDSVVLGKHSAPGPLRRDL